MMTVEISNMLALMVSTIIALTGRARAGYHSQMPSTSLELPNTNSGQYSYGYPSPYPQNQQAYQYSQNQQAYQYPQSQQSYQYSQNPQVYPYPQNHQVYQYPQSQQSYQYPQSQPSYQFPQSQPSHQYPQSQQTYQTPQNQQAYQYPQYQQAYQNPHHQQAYQNAQSQQSSQYLGNSVTYSVAPNDYEYLRQYRNGQYHYHTGAAPAVSHHDSNDGGSSGQYSQSTSNFNGQSSTHSSSIGSSSSANIVSAQSESQQSSGAIVSETYNPSYASKSTAGVPAITKHIYFHVPPSEVDDRPLHTVPSTPPKKVYNIVFIKVPSQESRSGASIQGLAVNQQATVEDKTLIYVLVKKPDPQPLVQSPPVNSQHEVFYVKYKGDVNDVAGQINNQLGEQNSLQSSSSVLQSDVQAVIEPAQQGGSGSAVASSALQPGLMNGSL